MVNSLVIILLPNLVIAALNEINLHKHHSIGLYWIAQLKGYPSLNTQSCINNRFLRKRHVWRSTPKWNTGVFLCIFQKNSAMATLGRLGSQASAEKILIINYEQFFRMFFSCFNGRNFYIVASALKSCSKSLI